jgi:outer membrane protein TolC
MSALVLVAMVCSQPSIEASEKKIKELHKERITILKELVDQVVTQFRSGVAGYAEVLDARMLLQKSELDAAEKSSDRIAIYQKTIEDLKASQEWVLAMVKAGKETNAAVLKIKARRLEVEILLEQERIKAAKEKK